MGGLVGRAGRRSGGRVGGRAGRRAISEHLSISQQCTQHAQRRAAEAGTRISCAVRRHLGCTLAPSQQGQEEQGSPQEAAWGRLAGWLADSSGTTEQAGRCNTTCTGAIHVLQPLTR